MFFKTIPMIASALALTLAGMASAREVTDMAGRTIDLPAEIETVVTLGSVPVINGFIMAAGKGGLIASDLPPRFRASGRWGWQDVFAPQLSGNVQIADAEGNPDLEAILTLGPDVAFTFAADTAELLEANGIPTVMLRVQTPDDVKNAVATMGDVFGNDAIAADYAAWFDETLAMIAQRLEPADKRPDVLYINPANMTQPHLVAEWWIKAAGGNSLTDDGRKTETLSLTTEVVLAADPDFIIVGDPLHVAKLKEDANLASMAAVRSDRILVAPMGAHIWANRTVEQPLTVLWAASQFHPELFPQEEAAMMVKKFYAEFFKTNLTDGQVDSILGGGL